MGDSDFVIFVQKSDKCKKLLEAIDERLATYNKKGLRVFIKKVTEDTLPADITKLPTCNVRGYKAEGTSAIISSLDKLCKPKRRQQDPDDIESYNSAIMGDLETYKKEKDEIDDVGDDDMSSADVSKMMADYSQKASKYLSKNEDSDEDDSDTRPTRNNKSKNKGKYKPTRREPDSGSDDELDYESDEPEDNIDPDANLDLDEEMMNIIKSS